MRALCGLTALCLLVAANADFGPEATGAIAEATSPVPPQTGQLRQSSVGNIVSLLSQFSGEDHLEENGPEATAGIAEATPPESEQDNEAAGGNIIPLLSQFSGEDPLEAESTSETGPARQKRTFFCKKCGYGGGFKRGRWGGGHRKAYGVVVPVYVVVKKRPVYRYGHYPRRGGGGYCDPCRRGNYHPGGGSYSYSSSQASSYSWGRRK